MENRTEIVMELASAMGHGAVVDTLRGPAKYDSGTKTLYCNGQVIPKATIQDAKAFFEEQKAYFLNSPNHHLQDAATQIAYFNTAIEAIGWMLEQENDLGRRIHK